jgi:hypothetical protein
MGTLAKVLAGVGTLIGMYLILSRADETAKIIQTISSNSTAGIKVLQGR